PDGSRVYVAVNLGVIAAAVPIATSTNTAGAPIFFPGSFNEIVIPAITITPDGTHAYLAGELSDDLSILATSTNTLSAVIPFPSGTTPVATAVTPNGAQAYVALFNTSFVAALSTTTNALNAIIAVGNDPTDLAATPDGSAVY